MKDYNSGQTLVEAVVVVGIVVLLVTGLIAGTTVSLRSVQSGRARSQAVSLAQEGLELVRAIRDESWNTFDGLNGMYCVGEDRELVATAGSCTPNIVGAQGDFTRSLYFDWQNPKMIVTSTVSFVEAQTIRDVTLTTYFTQWK